MTELKNGLLQLERADLPIELTPSLGCYAAALGYDPKRCKMEVVFHKAKILDKTFLYVEYVQNIIAYAPENESDSDVEVSEVAYCDPIKRSIKMFIHKDLENAFKKLTAHVLFINCLVSDDKYNSLQEMQFETLGLSHEFEAFWTEYEQRQATNHDYMLLGRVNVLGVSFSGAGENESVSIASKIKNQYGKEFPNNTTLVKIDDAEEKYYFAKHLNTAVENLKSELIQYMYFGKVGEIANNQLDMFNGNQD